MDECKPLPPPIFVVVAAAALSLAISRATSSSMARSQGLTLVHFSAQLEPCLTHKTPYTPYTP